MELTTISAVSKQFNISTRALRYYEQIGLIKSSRMPDYAYRAYDAETIRKIKQILMLRKLKISLKQISKIFENDDARFALKVFEQKAIEIEAEIDYLNALKSVIKALSNKLISSIHLDLNFDMADELRTTDILGSLAPDKDKLKEKINMEDVKKVREAKDEVKDVRIVYLPPATVACAHYVGDEPEMNAAKMLDDFVEQNNLTSLKPDLRVYGFNNPCPQNEGEEYGYEFWVTIPDDLEIDEPLQKKQFAGGMYAAYCIKMGDFHMWGPFYEWVKKSEEYDFDEREPLGMGGTMEEHINAVKFYNDNEKDREYIQLDLLIPIREK